MARIRTRRRNSSCCLIVYLHCTTTLTTLSLEVKIVFRIAQRYSPSSDLFTWRSVNAASLSDIITCTWSENAGGTVKPLLSFSAMVAPVRTNVKVVSRKVPTML